MSATVPETMTAIEITEPGGPEVLAPATRPVPDPQQGEVLIEVAAAGVNRPDCLQRGGNYPPPPGASDIPGLEVAGTVRACGQGVPEDWLGRQVTALVTGGGYAQYCPAPIAQCLPWPKGFDAIQAAALPETFFTVWSNVFDRGWLQAGEPFLVHGGSSGIGTVAIQLARAMGATVFATAGSAEKCALCTELGAHRAINYREEDFVAVLKEEAPEGIDMILDMVGGDYVDRNIKVAAVEGRIVQIAFLQGAKVTANLAPLMLKRLVLTGSTLRARDIEFKGQIAEALAREVWPLLENGTVKPILHATFPLEKAAEAHALMESSAHLGKIVMTV